MSLVNDMLKDLDRRQAPENVSMSHGSGYGALTGSASPVGSRRWIILLSIGVIALLGVVAWMALQLRQSAVEVTPITAEPVSAPEPSVATVKEPVKTQSATLPLAAQETQVSSPQDIESAPSSVTPPIQEPMPVVVAKPVTVPEEKAPVLKAEVSLPPPVANMVPQNFAVEAGGAAEETLDVSPATRSTSSAPGARERVEPVQKVTKLLAQTPEQKDADQASAAWEAFQKGGVEVAIQNLEALIATQATNARSRQVLAHIYIQQGLWKRAEALISESDMDQAAMRELKARILLARDKKTQALALLSMALPPIQEHVEYHALLAGLSQQLADHPRAVEKYTELLNIQPHEPKWWLGLGISLERLGQNQAAIKAYQRAVTGKTMNTQLVAYAKHRVSELVQRAP